MSGEKEKRVAYLIEMQNKLAHNEKSRGGERS
jgi:hypothetical protein